MKCLYTDNVNKPDMAEAKSLLNLELIQSDRPPVTILQFRQKTILKIEDLHADSRSTD